MSSRFKTVTVGSETYQLPQMGSSPPWGEELSDLIEAMVNALNTTSGAADITETSAPIANTSGAKDIQGLAFDPNEVRSAEISYNISRTITKSISSIPTATGTVQVTFSDKHNLFTGDIATLSGTNSTPNIDGSYTVTKISDYIIEVTIANPITIVGSSGNCVVQLVESGTLLINYGTQGWNIDREGSERTTFVDIDFTAGGQAQYNPTVLEGSNHSGLIKFLAKALLNT